MEPPDLESRAKLFQNYLAGVPISNDINFNELAQETQGFTGADIANICREAKTGALNESLKTGKLRST